MRPVWYIVCGVVEASPLLDEQLGESGLLEDRCLAKQSIAVVVGRVDVDTLVEQPPRFVHVAALRRMEEGPMGQLFV